MLRHPRLAREGLKAEIASTLAVVASSNEPLLFLAGDLTLIAASTSFRRAFELIAASGRTIVDLTRLPEGARFFGKPCNEADFVQSIIATVAQTSAMPCMITAPSPAA